MAKKEPEYKFDDFVCDCAEGTAKIFVTHGAMETARSDFKLMTQNRVAEFIANGGLEKPIFINKKKWENNTDDSVVIMVDAYAFFSGIIYGYIAFVYVTKTKKWLIKSFKRHEDPDPRNLVFLTALGNFLENN